MSTRLGGDPRRLTYFSVLLLKVQGTICLVALGGLVVFVRKPGQHGAGCAYLCDRDSRLWMELGFSLF